MKSPHYTHTTHWGLSNDTKSTMDGLGDLNVRERPNKLPSFIDKLTNY
jgi:hypothetical protein